MKFDPTPLVKPTFSTNAIRPVLRAVDAESGAGYRVVRKFTGGIWGAWLVRDRLDHDAVLKCIWDVDWRTRLSTAAAVVDELRIAEVRRHGICTMATSTEWEPGCCRSDSRDAPSSS